MHEQKGKERSRVPRFPIELRRTLSDVMFNGISFGGESLSIMDGMIEESLMTMKANNEQA